MIISIILWLIVLLVNRNYLDDDYSVAHLGSLMCFIGAFFEIVFYIAIVRVWLGG
jgi:hypothetical protein